MKIYIVIDVEDEITDPDHPTGLTVEGFEGLYSALSSFGDELDFSTKPFEEVEA